MDLELAGKRALLIGGGDEIDLAILRALLQQGITVAVSYPHEDAAASDIIAELERSQSESFAFHLQANDAQEVAQGIELVRQKLGQIEIVVNNASVISHAPLEELTLPQWQQTLDLNLTSTYLVTQAVLPILAPGASIIHVSACLAAVGMRGKSHYTAAKAGVIGFTRSICKELGTKGIRVNVVAPGVIGSGDMGNLSPEQRGRYAYLSALGRLGKVEEVAQTVLFLASTLSSFITGATIPVDGGVGGIAAF